MNTGSIYLLTNKVNGKKYVGQTIGKPERRWYFHIYAADVGVDYPLHRAIKKYGCENFEAKVIHTCAQGELDAAERRYIKRHDCMTPNGYNLTSGGTSGRTVSLATRKKQSESLKGRVFSEETRRKLSVAQKARFAENPVVWTAEARRKLSERNKGKQPSAACRAAALKVQIGRTPSAESRKKQSIALKGRKHTPEHRAKINAGLEKFWSTRRKTAHA